MFEKVVELEKTKTGEVKWYVEMEAKDSIYAYIHKHMQGI
jgi:hypothetical protein